jgi:TRAP-type mannitol/chloroaromatic compound transport system permease large subunit
VQGPVDPCTKGCNCTPACGYRGDNAQGRAHRLPACGSVSRHRAPIGLVFAVLGNIIGGIAAPTEAASMGAVGALLFVLLSGRLTFGLLFQVARSTLLISAMVFFILICAQVVGLAFRGLGGENLVERMFDLVPGGVTGQSCS